MNASDRNRRFVQWAGRLLSAVALAVPCIFLLVTLVRLCLPYPLERLDPAAGSSLTFTDRSGRPLRTLINPGGGRSQWVPLDQIATEVVLATLAGEDHRFLQHAGVDARAIGRAVVLGVRHRRLISGASTLTMQLVRLVDPRPRSLIGKWAEMIDAVRLERALGKSVILEQYLNRVYYGAGAWGIEAAARRFFGKSAASLGPSEATLLAVLPRAPSAYDPRRHQDAARARRGRVLSLMEKHQLIDAAARARIEAEALSLLPAPPPNAAPHFVDWVLAEGHAAGTRLRTTLDLGLQRRLESGLRAHLAAEPHLQEAGMVVLEPTTGAVRAMVGSADHGKVAAGQVNITTVARHPGSALKPFVYALALEQGATAASIAQDNLVGIPSFHAKRPMRERGVARYREALAGSFNLAAIDVLADVGVVPVLERLGQAGLAAPKTTHGLGLALGATRVRLLDLAAGYAAFVTGGDVPRVRMRAADPIEMRRVFSPATSWLVMDMLADPNARRSSFGADLPLDLPFPVAAKTGTSAGFADTVAVGATREAVVAAWAGSFDGAGTRGHLAMWSAAPLVRLGLAAVAADRGAPLSLPPPPPEIINRDVCRKTGLAPAPDCPLKREHFIAGSAPKGTCPGH